MIFLIFVFFDILLCCVNILYIKHKMSPLPGSRRTIITGDRIKEDILPNLNN